MTPIKKQRLSVSAAARLFQEFLRTICSAAWVDAILHPMPQTSDWQYLVGLFPPGLDSTRMRVCSVCRRIDPPNGDMEQCVDCEIEQQQRDIREAIIEAECEVVSPNLAQRSWRHNTSVKNLIDNPHGVFEALVSPGGDPALSASCLVNPGNDSDPTGVHNAPSSLGDISRREQFEWMTHQLGIPARWIQFYDPIPASSLAALPSDVSSKITRIVKEHDRTTAADTKSLRRMIRAVCKPLGGFKIKSKRSQVILLHAGRPYCLIRFRPEYETRNVSVGSGHSASCQLTMLSEYPESIEKEIAYFEKNERLAPSAKRFTRCNPFRRAREDHLNIEKCFVGRARGRKQRLRNAVAAE